MQAFLNTINHGYFLCLITLLLVVAASSSLGWIICRHILGIKWRYGLGGSLVELVLGIDLLALLMLFLGAMEMAKAPVIWTLLSVLALPLLIFKLPGLVKMIAAFIWNNPLFTAIFFIATLYTLSSALCYPYAWDELTYQISVPLRWLRTGSIQVFTDNPYSGFPLMPNLLFMAGLETGGILFPRLLVWAMYSVLIVGFYIVLRPEANKWAALICVVAFFLSPVLLAMMRETYVEPFILVNLVAALLIFQAADNEFLWRKALVCGVFAGAAASVKLTGAGAAVLIAIFLLSRIRGKITIGIREVVLPAGLTALVYALAFYLRPWLFTGNPVYPFMAELFSGSKPAIEVTKFHYAMGSAHFGVQDVRGFFTTPLLVAFYEQIFDGIVLGWQFIVFGVAGIFWVFRKIRLGDYRSWRSLWLVAAIGFYYIFWFFSSNQTRFLLPLYLLIIIIGLKGIVEFKGAIRVVMLSFVIAATGVSTYLEFPGIKHFYTCWQYVFTKNLDVARFLGIATRDKGYMLAMTAIAEKTTENSKIMLVFERRGLYMSRKYVIGTPYFQEKYFTPLPERREQVYKVLVDEEIDYILVGSSDKNPDHLSEYNAINLQFARMLAWLIGDKKLELTWFDEGYGLYKVKR